MTDAEIVAWFREGAASSSRGLAQAQSAAEIREFSQGAYRDTRAADAIEIISLENEQSARLLTKLQTADDRADALAEENARLRAAIESVEQLQRWANEMTHYHKGEWVLYADVIAALRKPDAAGGDDAK